MGAREIPILNELRAALAVSPTGMPKAMAEYCGMGRLRLTRAGLYEPDTDGFEAVILPVFEGDETIDLLAFRPGQPRTWWLRRGIAEFLGWNNFVERFVSDCVTVRATPMSWLEAGEDGTVILSWEAARRELLHVDLHAESKALGAELDRRLRIDMRPRVFVPKKARA